MGFVNDHLVKWDMFQRVFKVSLEHFIGGDDNVRFEQLGLETEPTFGHHVGLLKLSVNYQVTA